ncbi:MAG: chemotaxis protein CheD [Spirochaetes bacterium]|nr:chemotaxis protein CheD [Spirochaetota bacterium]
MHEHTIIDADGVPRKRVNVYSGEHYVTAEDRIISTLLGSCVAVCLYDPVTHVAGMNHFLLANRRYAKDVPMVLSEAGRYGVNAMELLINAMMNRGADRRRLKAKAFGGGAVFDSANRNDAFMCVGEVNSRFILEFLKNENIELLAADLGGSEGRVIHMHARDFSVYMRKIKRMAAERVLKAEHQYWREAIEERERGMK